MTPRTPSDLAFHWLNNAGLTVIGIVCMLPFLHVVSLSLSSSNAIAAGEVSFWPVSVNLNSYAFIFERPVFLRALLISLERVALGLSLSMLLIVLTAYPLSKERETFRHRTWYAWYFVFTMLFSGGLIPTYLVVRNLGLLDTIWALVVPSAVPVFSVVLLLNFLRGLPRELGDSAAIDGASEWQMMWRIYVPLCVPALATLVLFSVVGHWNSWFDGLIYNNYSKHYPLQTFLSSLIVGKAPSVVTGSDVEMMKRINNDSVKAAYIFIGAFPVILVYPFLQKYFMKGIVMGSVKG